MKKALDQKKYLNFMCQFHFFFPDLLKVIEAPIFKLGHTKACPVGGQFERSGNLSEFKSALKIKKLCA